MLQNALGFLRLFHFVEDNPARTRLACEEYGVRVDMEDLPMSRRSAMPDIVCIPETYNVPSDRSVSAVGRPPSDIPPVASDKALP